MLLSTGHHLSFCTNIFRGESWSEVRRALTEHLPRVKAQLSPESPFGLGLRLSALATRELRAPKAFEELLTICDENESYIFTLNGFPYGQFHSGVIKEKVYEPDWQTTERLRYTSDLAELLVRISIASARTPRSLSISTVPGGYRAAASPSMRRSVALNLVRQALIFRRIFEEHGLELVLALEPEPACLLETTEECVSFLLHEIFSEAARSQWTRLSLEEDAHLLPDREVLEAVLRRHLGVCVDTCHAAVQFEEPSAVWETIARHDIAVGKLQATAGLECQDITPEALMALRRFDDGIYLHQGTICYDGQVERFVDLPELIARAEAMQARDATLRVHFHVPVFRRELGLFQSTQDHLRSILALERASSRTQHVEVETYTFDVLPAELRSASMTDAICQEVLWVRSELERPAVEDPR